MDMTAPASEFLTPKEAAALLGISLASVYRLMESRSLSWTKIGGSRRIPRAALGAVTRSKFVGDEAVLEAKVAPTARNSTDSSKALPTIDQTRRAIAERFRHIKDGDDFHLAYAYRRVLDDLEADGGKGRP